MPCVIISLAIVVFVWKPSTLFCDIDCVFLRVVYK